MIFKKKIFFLTGKKGGYTSLLPLLTKIKKDKKLILKIIATDQHTQAKFGNTFKNCQRELGKKVVKVIKFKKDNNTPLKRVSEMSMLLKKTVNFFFKEKPHLLILYGDRLESLIAAIAASNLDIPICHFQGGDVSGNIDEKIRHSITKLSDIHLTSNKISLNRVLRMGEEKNNCFNIGDSHVDALKKINFNKKKLIQIKKKYKIKDKYILLMLHPTGFSNSNNSNYCQNVLDVLLKKKIHIISIYPCTDPGYQGIIDKLELYKKKNSYLTIYKNIPHEEFMYLLKNCFFFIGNSSSGIIESPYLKIPFINLGSRQNNRLKSINVINSSFQNKDIELAIKKIKNKNFKKKLNNIVLHYGDGNSYKKAYNIIKNKLSVITTNKVFCD